MAKQMNLFGGGPTCPLRRPTTTCSAESAVPGIEVQTGWKRPYPLAICQKVAVLERVVGEAGHPNQRGKVLSDEELAFAWRTVLVVRGKLQDSWELWCAAGMPE